MRKSSFLTFQSPPQIHPKCLQNRCPQKHDFFIHFCLKSALLQKCRHRFRIGFYQSEWPSDVFLQVAFCMDFRSKKPTKNLSKTRSEPFQNRCRKRVDFQHRFFKVLASIWEGLEPPRWSQVGHFGFKNLGMVLPKSVLKLKVLLK